MAEQDLKTRQEAVKEGGEATFWQKQLDLAEKDHEAWIKQGRDVVERYKGDTKSTTQANARKKANILYSNTEVLKAALFARMAKPDVRRRFSDQDPTGRIIAELLERSLVYTNDCNDSEAQIALAIDDYCLPGRGIVRVHYEAKIGSGEGVAAPEDGEDQTFGQSEDYVTEQEVWDEYVNWEDYRHEPCPAWDKLTWEAYRHLMTMDDLTENFGENLGEEKIKKIPLSWQPAQEKKTKTPEGLKKAEVWEIWDKVTRTRVWLVKGYDELLRKDRDPYGLEDFFPRPTPLQATTTTDTIIPQPEFLSYKDQADALDEIDTRIDRLTKALKRRGMYNASIPELKKLATLGDNQFVPGEKWSEFAAGGGLKGNFEAEDFSVAANVLDQLHAQREQRIQSIYEIMGIADIMRGISNPSETLGAQQLKAQFGGNRLKKRQDAVQKFIRDLMRVKAEIIAEHFEPERLSEMTGFPWQPYQPQMMQPPMLQAQPMPAQQQLQLPAPQMSPGGPPAADPTATPQPPQQGVAPPEATPPGMGPDQAAAPEQAPDQRVITPEMMEILRTDRLRSYRVDVETDSTIYEDAEAERTSRVELLTAMTQFVGGWMPIIEASPQLMPLAFEMLAFGVRGFKTGRQLEESIEQTRMQLEQAAKSPAPPPPDPAVEAEQAKIQLQAQKNEQDGQIAQAKMAQEGQHKQMDLQLQDKHHTEQLMLDREKHASQLELERDKLAVADMHKQRELAHQAHEGEATRQVNYEKMAQDGSIARDQMADSRDERSMARDDAERQREFDADKEGVVLRDKKEGQERVEKRFREQSETFKHALDHVAKSIEKISAAVKDVSTEVSQVNKKVDVMAKEIAEDQAAPISFETGSDGRISGFSKGKRKVSIKRDPKTGRMSGAH